MVLNECNGSSYNTSRVVTYHHIHFWPKIIAHSDYSGGQSLYGFRFHPCYIKPRLLNKCISAPIVCLTDLNIYLCQGGYGFGSVCLSVGLSVCLPAGLRKNYQTYFHETWWRGRAWAVEESIRFWIIVGPDVGMCPSGFTCCWPSHC